MKINQEKEFKPLTVTIESKGEYIAFVQIVDEVNRISTKDKEFMEHDAERMAIKLSNYFSSDV